MILALETSTPRASLALFDNGAVVWESDFTTARAHNAKIFEPVAEALKIAGDALELIAVGIGPGSYSGVRVGISVTNGLGLAREIPVIGVSSLSAFSEASCTVISDARRKTFAVATVENRELVSEPDLIDAEKFRALLLTFQAPLFTPDTHIADEFESISLAFPTATELAKIAAGFDAETVAKLAKKPLEPHYLRPPFITVAKKKPSFRK